LNGTRIATSDIQYIHYYDTQLKKNMMVNPYRTNVENRVSS